MEKKPEGDQNNQSNPTEETKPATPGKLPTFFLFIGCILWFKEM